MICRLAVFTLVVSAVLRGDSYEIRPAEGGDLSPTILQCVPGPLGVQELLYCGNRLAVFDEAGQDIDIIWWKPQGKFFLARKNGNVHIWAKDWMKAGSAEMFFDNVGNLTSFRREAGDGQRERDAATIVPNVKLELKHFWLKPRKQGDFWQNTSRLRLGYKNPNSAGTLFAELAVLAFAGLLFLSPFWARIAFGGCLAASLVALLLTESRGSFLGFCIGALILVAVAVSRRFTVKRLALCVGGVAFIVGLLAFGVFGERFGRDRPH